MTHLWIARVEYASGPVITYRGRWPGIPLVLQRERALEWARRLVGEAPATVTLARLVGELDARGLKRHRIAEKCYVPTKQD